MSDNKDEIKRLREELEAKVRARQEREAALAKTAEERDELAQIEKLKAQIAEEDAILLLQGIGQVDPESTETSSTTEVASTEAATASTEAATAETSAETAETSTVRNPVLGRGFQSPAPKANDEEEK